MDKEVAEEVAPTGSQAWALVLVGRCGLQGTAGPTARVVALLPSDGNAGTRLPLWSRVLQNRWIGG